MVRQGDWKLILYGSMPKYEQGLPPQLFNLVDDPWEVQDVSRMYPDRVSNMTKILDNYMDWRGADAEAKEYNRWWFRKYIFDAGGGSHRCMKTMRSIFGRGFNSSDAMRTAEWLGVACQ